MKTIKLPYKTTEDLTSILKQYSNVVRYSYNRFLEGKAEKDTPCYNQYGVFSRNLI